MSVAIEVSKILPAAVASLGEILNLIATLRAQGGLTDEELQSVIDSKIDANNRALLALLLR